MYYNDAVASKFVRGFMPFVEEMLYMNMQEIRKIAKEQGIKSGRLSKIELVRAIQAGEGNYTCFGTEAVSTCNQDACLWREDCFATMKKPLSS